MQQIVSITSQGQITIPASMRRSLAFNIYKKAIVKTEDNKIIVEPLPDFLSLGGVLKKKAIKNQKIDKIIRLEKEAVIKAVSKRYQKSR